VCVKYNDINVTINVANNIDDNNINNNDNIQLMKVIVIVMCQ